MGKLAITASKYTIYIQFDAEGTVEKPDVIGAVFGQTEGLLGPEMDLRELQRTGRVGRIDVNIQTKGGKSSGLIIIPTNMDAAETALLAACMETIERVGPCNAKVYVEKIEDVRISKREHVVERAREFLGQIFDTSIETDEISEQLKEELRSAEISSWNGLPAGPNINLSEDIVIVEGRADVVNLLRHGIKNAIAMEGTNVPPQLAKLSREKEVTVFLDGDRGGDLLLKELAATCEIDFVARAPEGKEVEELAKKEVFKALRDKVPFTDAITKSGSYPEKTERRERYESRQPEMRKLELNGEVASQFKRVLEELVGTRAAYLMNENLEIQGKVPVREMFNALKEIQTDILIFDGNIDQKLVTFCAQRGVRCVVGMRIGQVQVPEGMQVITIADL